MSTFERRANSRPAYWLSNHGVLKEADLRKLGQEAFVIADAMLEWNDITVSRQGSPSSWGCCIN